MLKKEGAYWEFGGVGVSVDIIFGWAPRIEHAGGANYTYGQRVACGVCDEYDVNMYPLAVS